MTEKKYDHYPIRDKRDFDSDSFRTITLDPERNIKGVVACKKGYWSENEGRCRKGTELQKFLYPLGITPSSLRKNPALIIARDGTIHRKVRGKKARPLHAGKYIPHTRDCLRTGNDPYCPACAAIRQKHDPSGARVLIENPTAKEAQAMADALQCPVAVVKELDKEIEMYERFHHKKPDAVLKASHPEIPGSLVALGRLESVIYRKNGQSYIHDLDHGVLAADRKGKLYIIGDKAKITERGIVG